MSNEAEKKKVKVLSTVKGWPMVAIDPAAIVKHILVEKAWILEPWQARNMASRLETLAGELTRRAAEAEAQRCTLLGGDTTEAGIIEANISTYKRICARSPVEGRDFHRIDQSVKGEGMPAVEGGEA